MLFMFMWDFIFTILLYILNSGTDDEDYPMLPPSLQLLTQIWRNSLGDIGPPGYDFWMEKREMNTARRDNHGYIQATNWALDLTIYIIWSIWFTQTVFNMVIMLNFMIAIVSESYERVMSQKNKYLFRYKSYMNQAIAVFENRLFNSK